MSQQDWLPVLEDAQGPIYLQIVRALEHGIQAGELAGGDKLPPQRALAAFLKVDFTTVTRAYAEAQRRGLVEARVGRGTFVRAQRHRAPTPTLDSVVDMQVNHPPRFDNAELERRMWNSAPLAAQADSMATFMRYRPPAGSAHDRAVGAQWLAGRIAGLTDERIVVCPGTQGALLAATMMLASKGDTLCVEALSYPGFILLAQQLGIKLVPVAMDAYGACPDALDAICAREKPKAFYCTPTLHNPTTTSMPAERRHAIAEVARKRRLPIIEDDNYWPFMAASEGMARLSETMPPLAALIPDLVYYISGLAKCVSPALRIAYMVLPDAPSAERAAVLVRATASMASPLNASLASQWIEDGTAAAVLQAICTETTARQALARHILPGYFDHMDARGFHLWLQLPPPWTRSAFAAELRRTNISVAQSDAFAVHDAPEAVRLCLGGPVTRADLEYCLQRMASLLAAKSPPQAWVI